MFNLLIADIDNIDTQHHVIAGVFIPAIAIINVFVMTNVANFMEAVLELRDVSHNPILISVIYVVFFIAPYVFYKITGKKV